MKKVTQLTAAVALASSAFAVPAMAEVSGTLGVVSDYYFRGQNLGDAGAFASLDYENSGFYAGTWWIDDSTGGNDGMETDFYLGYGQELESFTWNVGYNRYEYTYTSDFEHEIGLSLGVANFSIDLFLGEDDDDGADDAVDYTILTLGYSAGAFGAVVGATDYDLDGDADVFDYEWAEVSFSGDLVEGIEGGVNVGWKTDDNVGGDEGYMFSTASKSFDL